MNENINYDIIKEVKNLFNKYKNKGLLEAFDRSASYDEFYNNILGGDESIKENQIDNDLLEFYKEIEDSIETKAIVIAGYDEGENPNYGDIDIMNTKFNYKGYSFEIGYTHVIGDNNNIINEIFYNKITE